MYGITGNWLGTTHLAFAFAAIGSGTVIMLLRKGSRYHRWLGWSYAVAMAGLNASALFLYRLTGHFGPFHAAAIVSLATLILGIMPARRRFRGWIPVHARLMAWSYVGLLAAAAAEVMSRVPESPFWTMVALGTGAVLAAGWAVYHRYPS